MKDVFRVPNALNYKGDSKNWHKFKRQFDVYMKATGFINNDSENKVNVFLNIAGEEALEIYNNLKLTPEEKTNYESVIEAFEEFCSSKQNVIYKSFKFFTRVQQPGEYFNDFYNDLQVMATFCDFGDQKERLIRDRIIVGILNEGLREKFLKEPDLALDQVVHKCCEDEVKKIQNGEFKSEENGQEIAENEESNNNYEEIIENVENYEEFREDEVHIPNEVLFNDLEPEVQNGDEEELLIETIESERDEDITEEFLDVKPSNLSKMNTRNPRNNVEQSPRILKKNRKGRVLEKRKNAETIQMKIEEIKKKLNNTIKKEVDSEQMGIRQKFTRSSFRRIDIKCESREQFDEEESEKQDEEEETEPQDEEEVQEYEEPKIVEPEKDLYEFDEEDEPITNTETSIVENYYEEVEENVDAEGCNENEAEQDDGTIKKRGRKRKGTKKNEVKIIKVKRGNLPPLILKSVRKKTLLLGKMPYPCKKCDSSFWTSVQLERHQLVHVLKKVPPPNNTAPKRIFKCEECGKEFKKICDLERHTRVHTGEKPSVCNICNKRFQQAYNLNKHLLIHTQEKNFECIICQKKFGRNDVLNRHVLTHSIDKPFHCSICSKTFIRNTQLNLHIRKHHGAKADPKKAESSGAGKSSD